MNDLTLIVIYAFLIVGIPWLIISAIVEFFKNLRVRKKERAKQKEYDQNPCLRFEERIRSVEYDIKKELRGSGRLMQNPYGPGGVPPKLQSNLIGQGYTYSSDFKSRYAIKASEIRKEITKNSLLSPENKSYLFNYLDTWLGGKIKNEQIEKEKYDAIKLAQYEKELIEQRLVAERFSRRKTLIDRLAGVNSYVLIDSGSPLFKKSKFAFVFKSNNWEYRNGDYILEGANSYDEGVVNLYKILFRLKRRNEIKKRNAFNDPQMI